MIISYLQTFGAIREWQASSNLNPTAPLTTASFGFADVTAIAANG
jgi:hypothetical protein